MTTTDQERDSDRRARWAANTAAIDDEQWNNQVPGTSVPEAAPTERATTKVVGSGSFVGNLAGDPELIFVKGGTNIAKMRVARIVRRMNPETGQWQDAPAEFTDVVCFGSMAERCIERLRKGDRVMVSGLWQQRSWTGRDGTPQHKQSMTAQDIGLSLKWSDMRVVRTGEENNL